MVLGFLQQGCLRGTLRGLAVLSASLRSQVPTPQARKRTPIPHPRLTPAQPPAPPPLSLTRTPQTGLLLPSASLLSTYYAGALCRVTVPGSVPALSFVGGCLFLSLFEASSHPAS